MYNSQTSCCLYKSQENSIQTTTVQTTYTVACLLTHLLGHWFEQITASQDLVAKKASDLEQNINGAHKIWHCISTT
ncbi:hypothetical protein PVAP13_1KG003500 [Panicum virgatum]|uniref:Uncharacterized protein n=1 Tax=Panicum virgatum TaxID=38727 RepID=A0A8T0X8N7_PANVG|nr:hypothetical protein PVAP13_1KG003500 [Panicum virgatum]